jgi:hypothetical protein
VANYFSIYKGTENGMAKLMVPSSGICQPSLERALEFIKDAWEEVRPPHLPGKFWREVHCHLHGICLCLQSGSSMLDLV